MFVWYWSYRRKRFSFCNDFFMLRTLRWYHHFTFTDVSFSRTLVNFVNRLHSLNRSQLQNVFRSRDIIKNIIIKSCGMALAMWVCGGRLIVIIDTLNWYVPRLMLMITINAVTKNRIRVMNEVEQKLFQRIKARTYGKIWTGRNREIFINQRSIIKYWPSTFGNCAILYSLRSWIVFWF